MRSSFISFVVLSALYNLVQGAPSKRSSSCTGTISSLSDVTDAVECTTVNINAFTVPAGETFSLSLLEGTTVNLNGNVAFGNVSWAGPLFEISGTSITFNGNSNKFDGGGPFYWDGQGTNGGVTKPHPMMKIKISGTWTNVHVVNSPAQVYSVGNPAALTMSNLVIDNSQGNYPNSQSGGLPAGHNTDGFDASTKNLVIENSTIMNQDDCIAINEGSNIVFSGNTCEGGHGISIGSVTSNVVVSGIVIKGNTVINEMQAFRIKTDAAATNSTVTNITYSGNTATGIGSYGVLIDQSYPSTLGTPGNGVIISDITFEDPTTTITVNSTADKIAINCGSGSCTGTWNWNGLLVNGGDSGPVDGFAGISGYTQ
ncbi:glycoside hydrolase family 28 protein [Crepidotus variabilis]|uniref:endo-polygalacturonase n=1 Tax=Crepidotus variabilis TaxID=179855 RepID=A0A9P6E530_9AGAR|nr:glycoside hydrolase family 28 protein [Crepidotus variabilis]